MKTILGTHETRGLPVVIILLCVVMAVGYIIALAVENHYKPARIYWHSPAEPLPLGLPVFIYVHSSQCRPCVMMEESTFQDPRVVTFLETKYHNLLVNADDAAGSAFCKEYGINVLPTFLLMTPRMSDIIWRIEGFIDAETLLGELQSVALP